MATAEGSGVTETKEWIAAVEASGLLVPDEVEDAIEDLLHVLAEAAPAVSVGSSGLELRFNFFAARPEEAIRIAGDRTNEVLAKVGLDSLEITRIELTTAERLDRSLEEPNMPPLLGVAELADLIGVSRQRASELARTAVFPSPMATLAAGPVWAEPTILRFVETWQRRPGRRATGGREVIKMSKQRRTGKKAAKAASSVLKDGRTSSKSKTAAASALSQAAPKRSGRSSKKK